MADILSRRSVLQIRQAQHNDRLCAGTVYIAPPNQHLLVNGDGSLSLTHTRLREAAINAISVAQLVVDHNGLVVEANQQLRVLFGLSYRDIGRPLQDLEVSYRPVELRSCIAQARRNFLKPAWRP